MGSVIVGVIGTLLGVLIGGALQQVQALHSHKWQREDVLNDAKRRIYTEYLRSISASYSQARSGERKRSEDASLRAATAEITILSGNEIHKPAGDLTERVLAVHSRIAAGSGVTDAEVDDVDQQRRRLIDLFKSDLGVTDHPRRYSR
ncbi:hypothetical protein Sipo8835_27405 [Streptomyces ipomoeae]|uniref:Uncharacterized protein n=2 Tax=Streptomyces ipomoeae TaxID=103232 RepID=L1L8F9_9ACTN|nr:hypothetical protein [Streptomyces ipomoeae]EKX69212.1 hypothetical protein STRIP9103_05042 [Streptomyces ipomoeae 91-03]MDX2699216.1 hypothetical protein [Streptomyces ipomoeae]MDX2826668.1 hypothetical protein [Streptomyces ipomoeae]MDX2844895.1 hypothetical protein [Streptomyces ipomoeae]MDX2877364.1 hypothetical protein [Streptomyces ipomoeae]